ncbi:hypothetical protein [Kordiimonas gwangyangensis]|uniref:hypothetical protein n=1 Tax=Kordiimonas gwangyangensis TaxID=288022 RepID=UPI0003641D6F|nr:hypothetical protein [Kordiimonas gwangyangensis]
MAAPLTAAKADDLIISDNGLTAGYATLAWPNVEGKSFVLEENVSGNWRPVYDGPDRATTLSGRADGDFTFRLKADGQLVGDPMSFTVAHHPLSRAWAFFAVGAAMFVALVGVLLRGSRKPIPQISPTNAEQ